MARGWTVERHLKQRWRLKHEEKKCAKREFQSQNYTKSHVSMLHLNAWISSGAREMTVSDWSN
jgi:hypothetical protein